MSSYLFTDAKDEQPNLRLAIVGPEGSGKTWTALAIATNLGDRVGLIDTENGSAAKYRRDFPFKHLKLSTFAPLTYVQAIEAAATQGFDVLIIDSLSHAWSGKDGALEQVDRRAAGNKFSAWREVTPMHNALVDAIVGAPMHVIATMRAKTEYAVEQDGGKTKVVKLGLAPVQRDGISYEFDVIGDIDQNHNLRITKTRCRELDNEVIPKPGAELAETLKRWLGSGDPAPPGADPDVLERIRDLEEKLAAAGAVSLQQFSQGLRRYNVKAVADLSAADATDLLARLEAKLAQVTEPPADPDPEPAPEPAAEPSPYQIPEAVIAERQAQLDEQNKARPAGSRK